jgi:hypothetical protein
MEPEAASIWKHSNLLTLSDDLVGNILFSGYLSKSWSTTVGLILVNKTFFNLAKRYLEYCDQKSRLGFSKETCKLTALDPLGIGKVAEHLVYLDIGFCPDLVLTPEFGSMLLCWKSTLRGLNVRSMGVDDVFLGTYICQLVHLRFLDVSQMSAGQRGIITDEGCTGLSQLSQLRWLNISMTDISDKTVQLLSSSCPSLTHVNAHSCRLLTDAATVHLRGLKLRTLDISNCPSITGKGMQALCEKEVGAIHNTLENLACSFLPAVPGNQGLQHILQMPLLRKLEFRKRLSDVSTLSPLASIPIPIMLHYVTATISQIFATHLTFRTPAPRTLHLLHLHP